MEQFSDLFTDIQDYASGSHPTLHAMCDCVHISLNTPKVILLLRSPFEVNQEQYQNSERLYQIKKIRMLGITRAGVEMEKASATAKIAQPTTAIIFN